jgi:hypothetical protein
MLAAPLFFRFLPRYRASASARVDTIQLQWWSDLDAQKDEYPTLEKEWADSHPGVTIKHHLYSMAEYLPCTSRKSHPDEVFGKHSCSTKLLACCSGTTSAMVDEVFQPYTWFVPGTRSHL